MTFSKSRKAGLRLGMATAGMLLSLATAAAEQVHKLEIRDHRFEPAELRVPANQKIKLVIHNTDPSAEEFESYELKREKVIPPQSEGVVFVGPLAPGEYPFFGDFNQATAQGRLIAE